MLSLHAALVAMALTGGGSGETVLLDFYADWCGPCRSMMPTVERLSAAGYPVRRMNVDQYRDLAQRFNVTSIPCFVMIVDGREVDRVVGPTSLGHLEQLCSMGRVAAPVANPNAMLATPAPTARGIPASSGPRVAVTPAAYASPPQGQPVSDAAMLAASVRLRVEDPLGHSCGSGTIIDARAGGEALVLTCGHLFRDSQGTGKIDVDVFGPSPASRVSGRLVAFDLERDVALIAFQPPGPVMVARVAPPGYSIRRGDAVASVGCNNGDNPTVQHSQVNSLDRFLDPVEQRGGAAAASGQAHAPWNLQVAGEPVVGRSGGGLFSAEGMVIGVCNAKEPEDHEGLFAALGSIHAVMDQKQLGSLYRQPIAAPAMVPAAARGPATLVAADPFATGRAVEPRVRIPNSEVPAGATVAFAGPAAATAGAMTDGERAVIDKLHRRAIEGSEVVCIIRDRNNPQAKEEVITLDRASPAFVNQLAHAGQSQNIPTSLEVPKRSTPILEWDIETGWQHRDPLPR
jgi:thiol-disulfide isomerase/thioredoxin